MKQKCLIYGNCQTAALRALLSRYQPFDERFDIIELLPVQRLSSGDVPQLEAAVATTDVFLYQPVSDNYKGVPQLSTQSLLAHLPSHSQAISLPVAYFTGYHPEITYLRDQTGVVETPFAYHDLNLLNLYAEGKPLRAALALINSDTFYTESHVTNNLELTLKKLEIREQHLSIRLCDFIRENFQRTQLFHSFNHPSHAVLRFITESILKHLSIPIDSVAMTAVVGITELLGRWSIPIYPSLAQHLGLKFVPSPTYVMERQSLDKLAMVEAYFRYYDSQADRVPSFVEYTRSRT